MLACPDGGPRCDICGPGSCKETGVWRLFALGAEAIGGAAASEGFFSAALMISSL
jgi:hypothetical protein